MFQGSYCGDPPGMTDVLSHWNFDPVVLVAIALVAGWSLRQRSGAGLTCAMLLLLAFISPLCAASVALFAARSVHHLLLIAAAGALALAVPLRSTRRPIPVLPVLAVMTLVFWAWHISALYEAALANTLIYWAMQISILVSAYAYWRAIRIGKPVAVVTGLVGGAVQMGILGALLTFATRAFYPTHGAGALAWGITALSDQQIGGLIMWVGGMVPFAVLSAVIGRNGWRRLTKPMVRAVP